jgi:hypothetical protein
MLQSSGAALMALGLSGTTGFGNPHNVQANERGQSMSENMATSKPTIVFVHGAFADSSGWNDIMSTLLDLNGDRRIDVVVDSNYYEGASTLVYNVANNEARPALETGCGA